MNKFIKAIISFLKPILSCLSLFFIIIIMVSQVIVRVSKQYQFDENIDFLFLGDSHIACGVIDSLIPNSFNLSKMSEPYYYTYHKLKFVTRKSRIKKIILANSYHNFSSYYDEFINGNLSSVMPHKLFFCLEFSEQLRVLYWNRKKLLLVLKKIFLSSYHQFYNLEEEKNDYWLYDGYNNPFVEGKADSINIQDRILFQFYKQEKVAGFADLNIVYLNKIIDLCQEKNIEIDFINTPLHPFYVKIVPNIFKSKLNEFLAKNDINIIDLEGLNLSDSCYDPGGDHVTIKGAEITTRALIKELF